MKTPLKFPAALTRVARALSHLLPHHACLWAALGCATLLAFEAQPLRSAVIEAWVHRYNNIVSNANDRAFKAVLDAAGDIIVTGTTDDGITGADMLTIKYSGVNGSVLWQRRYNGPANSNDVARAVAVDGSGNVVVTGYSSNGKTIYDYDYYTAKYAATNGALLWEKRYNGPENYDDVALAVAVDGSGNVVVTGYSDSGASGYDYYTAKYAAADGALLWEQRYNGPENYDDVALAVAVDGSGNVVVTGYSDGGASGYNYYTAKYAAADGALLWEQRYNGPGNFDDVPLAVAVDGSGNVVVTGYSLGADSNYDYYTAKYAATNGALLWEERYNGPGNSIDAALAVVVDGSGNVVVTGYSIGADSYFDYYTAKYAAANGALVWEKRYNGPGNFDDTAKAVAVDGRGNVVVTGYSYNYFGDGATDYYTAKYAAADGALLWEKRYDGPAYDNDIANAVAVDGSGNVVVTGYSIGADSYFDYYTAKYAAGNGALLWEKRYKGPGGNYRDQAQAVAMDSSGNVVVTGYSSKGDGNYGTDYYTAKYAAADGALLWEKRYKGRNPVSVYGGENQANAVAVDSSGNVVVTGCSQRDYYTAKYATADGALLWEKRYNGTAYGKANAVAVDGSGNVVVTGYSLGADSYFDYYTAKYAAGNGALLWEKRYNSPENYDDVAQAVAVDGSGNVVVTGYSYGGGFTADYYTAKYAAADGALLWEQRYNRFGNVDDQAQSVGADSNGNVVVTGYSYGGIDGIGNRIFDYYTAKYAAANGALLWEKRYTNGGASAVAVDGNGNVVVTGSSQGDYYTAKYAAADGALLWEQRSTNGRASAVAVDGSGNVVVTGSSYNGTNFDYYTVKYAGTDGALLWEKRYNGTANGDDQVSSSRCLALGPNGMVAITGSSEVKSGLGSTFQYATVVYREYLPPISIALVPTGVRLRFAVAPGLTTQLQRANAAAGPWLPLITLTGADGPIEYIDTTSLPGSAFYRTRVQGPQP